MASVQTISVAIVCNTMVELVRGKETYQVSALSQKFMGVKKAQNGDVFVVLTGTVENVGKIGKAWREWAGKNDIQFTAFRVHDEPEQAMAAGAGE